MGAMPFDHMAAMPGLRRRNHAKGIAPMGRSYTSGTPCARMSQEHPMGAMPFALRRSGPWARCLSPFVGAAHGRDALGPS